ncbi:O-acetyl-ADP-ribose deacetylase MACROD1 [Pelomyxa schiedti]|nr:O-acetyl-ADP-ribose deacetylase MACROD1 [Pelomyxa schiedti]
MADLIDWHTLHAVDDGEPNNASTTTTTTATTANANATPTTTGKNVTGGTAAKGKTTASAAAKPTKSSTKSPGIKVPPKLMKPQAVQSLIIGGPYAPNPLLNGKIALFHGSVVNLQGKVSGGGGVDAAIHAAAGPHLKSECRAIGRCETGQTKITKGYKLPAKYVLHTVGPQGENQELLLSCYNTCLSFIDSHRLRTLAFCGISAGIYGYPAEKACSVALHAVRTWLETGDNATKVDRIVFANFTDAEVGLYHTVAPLYFPLA